MASRKAPFRWSEDSDQRRVQEFLEKAAPIILESRVLQGAPLRSVLSIAVEMGLSRRQMDLELKQLLDRGVIESVAWSELDPQPPDDDPPEDDPRQQGAAPRSPSSPQKPDRSRVRPPSPAPAARPQSGPPPVRKPKSRLDRAPATASAFQQYREFAQRLITKYGGVTPQCHELLAAEATRLGLSGKAVERALESLSSRNRNGDLPQPPVTPEQDPPTSEQAPADAFRDWVAQQLATYPSAALAVDDERGLVAVGVHKHRLAEVLAVHVVRDVATQRDMRLERDLEGASYNSTMDATATPAATDERLRRFYDQVAPILALHRGINAKSRVVLNAVAEQLGLSQEELDRALTSFENPSGDQPEEVRQTQRRDSFRRYLRRTMAQLPEGIITFKTEQRLAEAGEHFHGVAAKWIKPTIKEVASEIGARFISEQQAVDHIVDLVDDMLSRTVYIDGETRSRIYAEGTRWGLDPIDVEAILHQRVQRARDLIAADRRRTRWVLLLAAAGFVGAVGSLIWMFLPDIGQEAVTTSYEDGHQEDSGPRAETSPSTRPTQWWNDDLKIAVAGARVSYPEHKDLIQDVDSPLPSVRGRAYERLADELPAELSDPDQQQLLQTLLVEFFVGEPSEETARQLAQTLLRPLTAMDDQLPDDAKRVPAMFWSCDTVVQMLAHEGLPDERAEWLDEMLEAAVGQVVDRSFDAESLQRQCSAALAQHLYRALIPRRRNRRSWRAACIGPYRPRPGSTWTNPPWSSWTLVFWWPYCPCCPKNGRIFED